MDHGGQIEREGRTMSQVSVDGFDLCDNLPNSEALTVQSRNLNETKMLTQSLPLSQSEEGGTCALIQKPPLNDNGKDGEEVEKQMGTYTGGSRDEEEDIDEMMEDESEASSSLFCCQSPDIPMTDSSYSETGSLLETPYPLSPGTSSEPTSPVIPVVSLETFHPVSSLELSQSGAEVNTSVSSTGSSASMTESVVCTQGPTLTTGPVDFTTQVTTSDTCSGSPARPTCVSDPSDGIVKDSSSEQITSNTEPVFNFGATSTTGAPSSDSEPVCPTARTFTLTELTQLTTGPNTADIEFTSITSPLSSNQEQNTSTSETTSSSVSTCSTGLVLSPAHMESLKQLAQRDDDTHLPQYLHQIAEAFVLQKDYQRALWFIQLERLYHQRVLDNLNTLQQQWESHCGGTSSDLTTHHLDTLKHICQTHTRPTTKDAECSLLDSVRPQSEGGASWPSCTSTLWGDGGMEQRAKDSSYPVKHPSNLFERPDSPEKDREDPNRESEGRGILYGSKLTEQQGHGREEEGGVGHTISVLGSGLHPSAAEQMDLSKPAEQQKEDLGSALDKEAKGEKDEIEEATEALEMEDEGAEDEGEEKQKEGGDSVFCQKAQSVETLVCGGELEEQQLQLGDLLQEKLHDENQQCQNTQESSKTCLHEETLPPEEAHLKQQDQCVEEEEEEEEDYEADLADLIRETPSLDEMAKLITVEELSPAPGLVSILKKRSIYLETVSTSVSSELQPEKPTAKRRVRFKVPDDSYESEVGGGDSCLLLFLLCLVTVVISIGGTALYCALGDAQSSVCQDFSRNADFYIGQIHRGITQLQHWFASGS